MGTIRVSGLVAESIVDGKGMRFVVFCQGCPHHCPGCHNPDTHDFDGGREVQLEEIVGSIAQNPMLQGVTFSGGEPFCQAAAFAELARMLRALPGRRLDLMVYSGWTYEQLTEKAESEPAVGELLRLCDTLMDGPFLMAQRDLTLRYRGSRNQRHIDLMRTRMSGRVVLVEESSGYSRVRYLRGGARSWNVRSGLHF